MRRCLVGIALIAAVVPGIAMAQRAAGPDWRRLATAPDRGRLRAWRSAWTEALNAVRGDPAGAGMAAIARDPALFDPDRTMAGAMPPVGDYDCRMVKLGRRRSVGAVYAEQSWSRCRIDDGDRSDDGRPNDRAARRLTGLDGRQRPVGLLHPDTDARAVFLGSMTLADERPLDYGKDSGRDMVGMMERIGPTRWRLVLPRPAYQSILDLLELRPAGQRGGADAGLGRTGEGRAGSVAR
jgi:hypothetical protein